MISKRCIPTRHLTIGEKPTGYEHEYSYLGTIVNNQWDNAVEVKSCFGKQVYLLKVRKLFESVDLTITAKMGLLRCYVFSV